MKLQGKPMPYSSIVGGGMMLLDAQGRARFQLAFRGTDEGISREQCEALATQLSALINTHGLDVP